jgi:hypothetical protein
MEQMCNKMPTPHEGNPDKGYYCVYCGTNFPAGSKIEIPHVMGNVRPLPSEKVMPDRDDQ